MQQATTIKRFRSHPLYIVSILWKYLFILLVPVIRGLYYVIINSFSLENGFQFAVNISNWAKGAWMDIVFLLAFLSLGVLLWLSFTIEVSEEGLLIKRGVLKREVRFLPVSRYNCLSVVSPMSVRLFGGVYLRVDTPGGGLKQADLLMLLRTKAGQSGAAGTHQKLYTEEPICVCAGNGDLQLLCRCFVDFHLRNAGGQHSGRAVFRDAVRHL